MKSLAGSLVATLLGAAMLVIGVAGVAGAGGITGPVPEGSKRYRKWVLSFERPGDDRPDRPTVVIDQVSF